MRIGNFIQSCIYAWLNLFGRKVNLSKQPYLGGPIAESETIGEQFHEKYAEKANLKVYHSQSSGLIPDFESVLDPADPHLNQLDSKIATFYEQTAKYKLEVWSKWRSPISWFAKILIRLVSVEMKQLNIPIDALETSYGMSSAIVQLLNQENRPEYTCWIRKSNKSNAVVYSGFYSPFPMLDLTYKYVRVVFPLPNGNVTVMLRVVVLDDGSVQLISNHKQYQDTGYYRVHKNSKQVLKVKKIPIKEVIHVFQDEAGVLRTDHHFKFLGFAFLQLHYKILEQ